MKFKWDKKYLYWGVTAFLVIIGSVLFFMLLNNWTAFKTVLAKVEYVLSPIIIGLVIAYLLRPGLNFIERNALTPLGKKIFKKNSKKCFAFSRGLGIFIMLAAMLVVIFGLVMLVIPQLYESIEKLVMNMDKYIGVVIKWTDFYLARNPEFESALQDVVSRVLEYIAEWLQTGVMNKIDTIIISVTSGLKNVVMALFHFFIGIIVSIYVLYSKEKFSAQSKKFIYSIFKPKTANGMLEAVNKSDEMFVSFFVGKILDSAIIGSICAVFTAITGMPYFLLISVIIGVTNIIPFFGPYIGSIPCAFIILLESPVKCVVFIAFIIVLQTFDGNILGPKILGNRTKLTSFWVIFAILVGGGFFGFAGMVCGVPVFAVIYYFCRRGVRKRLRDRGLPVDTENYSALTLVDEETNEAVVKWDVSNKKKSDKTDKKS